MPPKWRPAGKSCRGDTGVQEEALSIKGLKDRKAVLCKRKVKKKLVRKGGNILGEEGRDQQCTVGEEQQWEEGQGKGGR